MKRDMNVIREILLEIEKHDNKTYDMEVGELTEDVICYHCNILFSGGFINDYKEYFSTFKVGTLTWEGHELLDSIRDDSIWNDTKKRINEKGLPLVLDVVVDVSKAIITEMTTAAIKGIISN